MPLVEPRIDDLLRALLHSNDAMRVHLAVEEFLVAAVKEARDVVRADFEDVVVYAKRTTLPADALGGCFEPRDATYEVLDAGFDVAASRAEKKTRGIDAKGPAAKAGLREGEPLVSVDDPIDTSEPMKVEVERAGTTTAIAFKPAGGTRKGQAFRRRPGLSDDACKKLALRK